MEIIFEFVQNKLLLQVYGNHKSIKSKVGNEAEVGVVLFLTLLILCDVIYNIRIGSKTSIELV